MSATPYYSTPNYYPPYSGDEWYSHMGLYELRKGPPEGGYGPEMDEGSSVVPAVCKRNRHLNQAGRIKGEELCVVCGDKASGYHYNALTCEGCKGVWRCSTVEAEYYFIAQLCFRLLHIFLPYLSAVFLVLHDDVFQLHSHNLPLCVGLSSKIQLKHLKFCDCSVTKCGTTSSSRL